MVGLREPPQLLPLRGGPVLSGVIASVVPLQAGTYPQPLPLHPLPEQGEAGGHGAAGSAGREERDSWESGRAGLSWNMCDLWRCKPI